MKKNNLYHQSKQAGYSLLELLLVITLSAMVVIGISRISKMWADDVQSDSMGTHMRIVADTLDSYIRNDANTFTSVPVDETAEIADDLPQGMATNGGTTIPSPIRENLTVLIREITNGSGQKEIQAIIFTNGDPIPNQKLLSAARAIGSGGGWSAELQGGDGENATSAFGLWNVDLLNDFGITLNVDQDGGQLVYFTALSQNEVRGPYLYRSNPDPLNPLNAELATMRHDLIMNGQDIRGVSNFEVDDVAVNDTAIIQTMNVTGDTNFEGSVTIGNADGAGSLTVGAATVVSESLTLEGDMNINIAGTLQTNSVEASNVNAGAVRTSDITTSSINVTGTDASIITGDLNVTGGSTASELVTGTVNADTVNSTNIIGENLTVQGNSVVSDMTVDNAAQIDIMLVNDCVKVGADEWGPACP